MDFSLSLITVYHTDLCKLFARLTAFQKHPDIQNLSSAEARQFEIKKVTPSDYRLFQAADMFCSMELIRLKLESSAISPSELEFFGNLRDLKKNYLKPLHRYKW